MMHCNASSVSATPVKSSAIIRALIQGCRRGSTSVIRWRALVGLAGSLLALCLRAGRPRRPHRQRHPLRGCIHLPEQVIHKVTSKRMHDIVSPYDLQTTSLQWGQRP
jgi:hypothetical protein